MSLQPNFDPGPIREKMFQAKQKFVGDIIKKKAKLTPDRAAVEWEGKVWTFKELNEDVNRLANSMDRIGIKRGQRISALSGNRVECAQIMYAVAKIGGIIAFCNDRYTPIELQEAIEVITPETIIVAKPYFEKFKTILPNLSFVKRIILLDDMGETGFTSLPTYSYPKLLEEGDSQEPNIELHEEDAYFIVYTSGTTGKPKGATISQRSSVARVFCNMAEYQRLLKIDQDDNFIARGAFFHVASVDQMFATHAFGGKVIFHDGYSPEKYVGVITKEKIGWLAMAPGMLQRLIDEIKKRNAKIVGVKAVGSMADLVPAEQMGELTKLLNAPYLNTYGLTEIGPHNFSNNVIPIAARYSALSKAEGFACEVRLLDSEGREVPDGEPGELVIRTTMMFSGYWNNPEENEKVFRDGWFHTGDVLRRNPDGTLDFVSRVKYMIKTGGENVYPAEIERALFNHPAVEEAVVVGVKHPKWGETPIAFVAVKEPVTGEELREFCRQYLSGFKLPNLVEVIPKEAFPKNANGKIEFEKMGDLIKAVEAKVK